MGHFFDVNGYPGIKSNADVTEGINSLGDALTDVLNRRQKAKQSQDELQFQEQDAQRKFAQNQGNMAYQNRIIDQRDKRDQLTFNQQQEEHKRKASIDAAKALADNNPEMAQAILHGTVTYDPATGAETGRGELAPGPMRDVGPAPEAPVEPQAPAGVPPEIAARRRGRTSTSVDQNDIYQREGRPMPAQTGVDPTESFGRPKNFIPSGLTLTSDEGPVDPELGGPPASPAPTSVTSRGFSPEVQSSREQATQDMVAEEQARMDQAAYGQQKTAFDAASAAYPEARARYDASRTTAERERPYTIRFGANDQGIQVTPEAQRYGHRQAAADDFVESLKGVNLDQRGQQAAQAAHAAIMAGEDPQKVYKAFEAARTMGVRFGDQSALQTQKDAAALERAKIAGPRNPGDFHVGQLHEQQEAGTIRDMKEFDQNFQDWERQAAVMTSQSKGYNRLNMAVHNIQSGNATQQHEAMSALGSFFSGGGAAREFEQKFLYSHLAGLGGDIQTRMEHIRSGSLGPDELAAVQAAVHDAKQEQTDRAKDLYDAAVRGYGPGSQYEYFGGNVDHRVAAALGAIGFNAPPMYPGLAPVQIGDIVRPYRSQLGRGRGQSPPPAPPPANIPRPPGAPPEVRARDKAAQKAKHDELMAP